MNDLNPILQDGRSHGMLAGTPALSCFLAAQHPRSTVLPPSGRGFDL